MILERVQSSKNECAKKTSKSQEQKSAVKNEHFLVQVDKNAKHIEKNLAMVGFPPGHLLFESCIV